MDRRGWFARLATFFAATASLSRWLQGQEPKEQASLEDRLNSGLKCRRQEEFTFVSLVSQRVETGQIPEPLVLQTMRWAVKKNGKFPFYYFEFAVRKQAEALGVSL